MAGETEIRAAVAQAGGEVGDPLGPVLAEHQSMTGEAQLLQCAGDDVERAFVLRGDARAADQRGGERHRVERKLAHSRKRSLIEVRARVLSSTFLTMTAQ